MDAGRITFDLSELNQLFPFYLMLDKELKLTSCGLSIQKICNLGDRFSFNKLFHIKRPAVNAPDFETLIRISDQMLIIEYAEDPTIVLRGQFIGITKKEYLLFIGSPWFGSMDQVREKKLTIDDFAVHDSMVDLLHVLKTQEIATEDMKELLKTVNLQKNKLKEDQKELKRLSLVASANENGVLFMDSFGNISWSNTGFQKISGFKSGDLYEKSFISLLQGPVNPDEKLAEISHELSTDTRMNFELPMYRKDSTFFWARIAKQPVQDELGDFLNAFVTVEDITLQKQNEQQLEILSRIAEDNINAVIIADEKGCIEWINKSFTRMTGFTMEEVRGKKPGHVLQGPETDPQTIAYLSQQVNTGEPFNCEILNYSKDGTKYWLRVSGQAIKDSKGVVTGFFALEEDITSQKEARQKLQESESRFATLVGNLQSGILLLDEHRNVVLSNPMFCHLFRIDDDHENIRGCNCDELFERSKKIFKQPASFMQRMDDILERHEAVSGEEMRLADGRYFSRDYVPIFVNDEYKGHLWNFSDITERKNYEKTLKVQEAKYRNIIANMNLGLLEVDENDIIEYANQSFCDISGFDLEQLIGNKASDIFLSGKKKSFVKDKNQQRKAGVSDFYQLEIQNAQGEKRWWLISGAPNYDDMGKITGSIGIHLDITEQKRLEEELELARQKAEEASHAKESFLANMSHEIRTPLNAIVGMVRELAKEELTQQQTTYLGNAKTASQHLLSIVNNILDISKIEAGEFQLEHQHFRLRDVTDETFNIMKGQAHEKSLEFILELSEEADSVYVGDPTRIRQILINLLGNAIKFTEKGSIHLLCDANLTSSAERTLQIVIEDTGIGMKKSYAKNLFKKFSQEDKSTARKYGGTGLGMALTSDLIHLMGGTIEIESKKGKGTRIEIQIALPPGDHNLISESRKSIGYASLEGLEVLLVEDNEMNRLVASNALEVAQIKITEALNGKEAINALKKKSFDLVLMDLQMPEMDGFSATRIIREEMEIKTPIIALSANAFKNEIDRCLEAGMNDFVTKPFDEDVLLNVIAENLSKGTKQIEAKDQPPPTDHTDSTEKLYDLSNLMQMSRGNDDFVRKMIRLFISTAPNAIKHIVESYGKKDFTTVKATAHRIKPSIDNLGISSIKEDIRTIEKLASQQSDSPELKLSIEKVKQVISKVLSSLKNEEILPGM